MTAPADLAEVRAALAMVAQATPGPLTVRVNPCPSASIEVFDVVAPDGRIIACCCSADDSEQIDEANAAAIVAIHNAAPAIAAAVEELTAARAEIAALRSQVCRLVSGQEIDGDHLCQHHGADVAALALLSDERAAHAETSRDLDALLTALGAQVTPGGQTLESCHARRVADGMRRASSIAAEIERARAEGRAESPAAPATVARPISEWHEDRGSALWWRFPVEEPPYSGSPLDSDWPGYHTHWTPIVCPDEPQGQADAGRASRGPIGGGS